MPLKYANNASSSLAGAILAADTALAVSAGDAGKFPVLGAGDWFPLTIVDSASNMEVVRVTARVGATLTIVRAQEGTTAKNFASGSLCAIRLTAAAIETFAPTASPAFTGDPTAPTPDPGDDTTSIATTAFVQDELDAAVDQVIEDVVGAAPANLDTLEKLAASIDEDPDFAATVAADISAVLAKVPDYVVGLILSNNSGNPNTHVDFAAGSVKAGLLFVSSASAFTKRVNATFAAGSGSGGLDVGAVAANATYFAYALRKDADASFDVVLSTSATVAGVTTTLLTGYTIVKCIGVVLTDGSSNIRAFTHDPKDDYTFTTPVKDAAGVSISTTSNLLALTVPNGVRAKAKLRFEFTSSATTNAALLHDPAQGVLTAGIGGDGGNIGTIQVASGFAIGSQEIWTDTSRQIRRVSGASGTLWVWTDGFYFPCGRIA